MKTVAVCFGRFNPPHIGHLKAWNIATNSDEFMIGTNPNTSGKKDPLTFAEKLKIVDEIAPNIKPNFISHQNWFTLVTHAYETYAGYNLTIITDEQWVVDSIKRYNGVKSTHGFYQFDNIFHEPSARITSSTDVRKAALNNNMREFSIANGLGNLIDQEQYFDLVKDALQRVGKNETISN